MAEEPYHVSCRMCGDYVPEDDTRAGVCKPCEYGDDD